MDRKLEFYFILFCYFSCFVVAVIPRQQVRGLLLPATYNNNNNNNKKKKKKKNFFKKSYFKFGFFNLLFSFFKQ